MSRRAEAVIDNNALRHNLARVRDFAPGCRIYAALKADAYGHGAVQVAHALADADGFALASVDEALQLRWAGIVDKPLMLLSTPLDAQTLAVCGEHRLQPVAFEPAHIQALAQYSGPPITVWIKLDTGMHRLGLAPELASSAHAEIAKNDAVALAGWLTHLGCADDVSDPRSQQQMASYDAALEGLPGLRSIANSAGIVAWPESHRDIIRPGIMLYGGSPLLEKTAQELDLQAVMTLRAPLISIRDINAGEAVGYGATWRAARPSRIGVVAIGYGDGYPRHIAPNTPVLLRGQRLPTVGRVSMDMITVDLSDCRAAAIGDAVTLWGQGLPADEIAKAAGTIAYELFCQVTGRVTFKYQG